MSLDVVLRRLETIRDATLMEASAQLQSLIDDVREAVHPESTDMLQHDYIAEGD